MIELSVPQWNPARERIAGRRPRADAPHPFHSGWHKSVLNPDPTYFESVPDRSEAIIQPAVTVRILVINGPNLNMLGKREPDVYGHTTLADVEKDLQARFPEVAFSFFQSNQEGDLIDSLQKADVDGIVLNGAGFTHTSVALRDGIASIETPVVEVHISNIHAREAFRHQSLTAGVCVGSISGLGIEGYALAVQYFLSRASA